MSDPHPILDAAFARVWATPQGRVLLTALKEAKWKTIDLQEIEERIQRARKQWATGNG